MEIKSSTSRLCLIAIFGAFIFPPASWAETAAPSIDAPKAIGPYAQAVRAGDTLYLSGQLPLDPKTASLVEGGIGSQTERVLKNLQAVLVANGMTLDDAVMAHVFITDLTDFPVVNEVYGRFFKTPPARATVEVKGLAKGALIEISLIAVRKRSNH